MTPPDPAALRVLFITPYVPSPLRTRPLNLIRQLARQGHRVQLCCIATSADDAPAAADLTPWCERVEVVRVGRARALGNCLAALPRSDPLQAAYCDSGKMHALVRALVPSAVDIVHVEHLRAVRFALGLRHVPCVYDSVDCISLLLERAARAGPALGARLRSWIDLARTRRFESRLLAHFRRVLVAAARDRDALVALGPGEVTVVPNGVDADHFRPDGRPRDPATLLFLGRLGYHANVRAARYLVDEIMPRIWARRPDARVVLAGADPARAVRALARRHPARVEVTGRLADVRPWLARATVSVNPLLYAVGMQNKVLEAMAMGAPVVATSQACGGLAVGADAPLAVADAPDAFAHQVVELLGDPERRRRLAVRARRYVEDRHDWAASGTLLAAVYRSELARAASPA